MTDRDESRTTDSCSEIARHRGSSAWLGRGNVGGVGPMCKRGDGDTSRTPMRLPAADESGWRARLVAAGARVDLVDGDIDDRELALEVGATRSSIRLDDSQGRRNRRRPRRFGPVPRLAPTIVADTTMCEAPTVAPCINDTMNHAVIAPSTSTASIVLIVQNRSSRRCRTAMTSANARRSSQPVMARSA